jgi:hypothetical protein
MLLLRFSESVAVPASQSSQFRQAVDIVGRRSSVAVARAHPHTPIRLWGVLVGTPRLPHRTRQTLDFFSPARRPATVARRFEPDKRTKYPTVSEYHQQLQMITKSCRFHVASSRAILAGEIGAPLVE